jgi:hypothetical protein
MIYFGGQYYAPKGPAQGPLRLLTAKKLKKSKKPSKYICPNQGASKDAHFSKVETKSDSPARQHQTN